MCVAEKVTVDLAMHHRLSGLPVYRLEAFERR